MPGPVSWICGSCRLPGFSIGALCGRTHMRAGELGPIRQGLALVTAPKGPRPVVKEQGKRHAKSLASSLLNSSA